MGCGDKSHNAGMSRKSSVHFKPVSNVRFAVSHSERTDLSEPSYLLPKEHQIANVVVNGSLSENELAALFIKQKEAMTGQAKARGSSPFWEGVVVLGNTDAQEQSANLLDWKKAYEQATGHRVLHMSIHLDEGYIDKAGQPQYNPHAHVIVSRMNEQNRVIKLERKELAAVQDLTAETLKMQRGSTLEERGGKRGRAHIGHKEFRLMADEARLDLDKPQADLVRLQKLSKEWSTADLIQIKDLQEKLAEAQQQANTATQKLTASHAAEIAELKAKYRADREAMKASGQATQQAYQALKVAHESALAELKVARLEVKETKAKLEEVTRERDSYRELFEKPVRDALGAAKAVEEVTKPALDKLFEPIPAQPMAQTEKTFLERLGASWEAFVAWIKDMGGQLEPVTASSRHDGPVVQLDDLHCLQKTGRSSYAIHELEKLDQVPELDNGQVSIRYRDGQGHVSGSGRAPKHR